MVDLRAMESFPPTKWTIWAVARFQNPVPIGSGCRLWRQKALVWILALLHLCCCTLGGLLHFSGLQSVYSLCTVFPQLYYRDDDHSDPLRACCECGPRQITSYTQHSAWHFDSPATSPYLESMHSKCSPWGIKWNNGQEVLNTVPST